MTTKTAVWEIATENHKNCPRASEKGTVLTMLMQALHLVDDGAEPFGVRIRHIILLICTHKHYPQIKLNRQPNRDHNQCREFRAGTRALPLIRLFTARYCDRSSRRSPTSWAPSACCGGGVTGSASSPRARASASSGIAREAIAPFGFPNPSKRPRPRREGRKLVVAWGAQDTEAGGGVLGRFNFSDFMKRSHEDEQSEFG